MPLTHRRRHATRVLVLLASSATLLSTAPAFAETPQSTARVVVTEANATAEKWAPLAYDCTADAYENTPAQSMVTGPQTPPLGAGSHEFDLSTPYGSVQTEIYRTTVLDGRLLSSVQQLEYSTYVTSLDENAKQPAYLRLTIDTDPGDPSNERHAAFFFPANQVAPVVQNAWQTWSIGSGTLELDGDGGTAFSLAGLAAQYPNARIANNNEGALTGGGLSIVTGCGGGTTRLSKADTDRVVVSASGDADFDAINKVYDFERDNLSFAPLHTTVVDRDNEATLGFTRQGYQDVSSGDDGGPAYLSSSSYVVGPATPPAGIGSLHFTNPLSTGVQQYRTSLLDGTKLADLRALQFSTFVTGGIDEQPGYLKLDLDTDHNGSYDRSLFYYPANNGPVERGAWQTWNATAGKWSIDGDAGPSEAYSLAHWIAQFDGAKVIGRADGVNAGGCGLPECGGLAFQVGGSDTNSGGDYYLDRLLIGTTNNSAVATQTLYDLEPVRPTISISGPATVTETSSAHVYSVTLSRPSDQTVTVVVDAAGGTATKGTDYTATPQTVTFVPGDTEQTYSVSTVADALDEADETYVVSLMSATVGVISEGQGSVTSAIVDDDATPSLRVTGASVLEPDTGLTTVDTFTVRLSAPSGRPVSVHYATRSGSANTADYVGRSGTLSFAAGQTVKTVDVTIRPDTVVERNESFLLDLSAPVNATIATASAAGVIRNDDSTVVGLYPAAAAGHKISVSVVTNERQSGQLVNIYRRVGTSNVRLATYRLSSAGALARTTLSRTFVAGERVTLLAQVVTPGGAFLSPLKVVTVS
ncbi:MAG TPA: Calx-beta domain-containing protein [Mycobacteriales bacterium]|nr:Calx-beta domain-containing protein [Mycobacteriales bacterium]